MGQLQAQSVPPVHSEMERLEYSFQSERLQDEQLDAFQVRAEQKINDWFEYVRAAADETYPQDLRQHMRQMAQEMRVDSSKVVLGKTFGDYLLAWKQNDQLLVLPLEPLSWQAWQRKSGKYYESWVELRDGAGEVIKAQVRLALLPKQFGAETNYVWSTSIAEIKK
jgi:hypothetical protein